MASDEDDPGLVVSEKPGLSSDPEATRAAAIRRLKVPATTIMTFGIVGMLASLCGIAYGLKLELEFAEKGEYLHKDPLSAIIPSFVTLSYCAIMMVGGYRMRSCKSYSLAMMAAWVTFLLILSLWGIVFVPFGIWALNLLNRREIKAAFASVEGAEVPPAQVRRAGTALMIFGSFGLFVAAVFLTAAVYFEFLARPGELHRIPGEESAWKTIFFVVGTLLLIVFVVVTYGALRMRQMLEYPMAKASAILAVLSTLLMGVLFLPLCLKALFLLDNPQVKKQFAPLIAKKNNNAQQRKGSLDD